MESADHTHGTPHDEVGGTRRTDPVVVVAGLLALVWLFSGAAKIVAWQDFVETIKAHGVLPSWLLPFAAAVPAAEILMGATLGIFGGSRRRVGPAAGAACLSVLLLLALSIYLMRVPEASLRSAGCGCHGTVIQLPTEASVSPRALSLAMNGVLTALHVPLLRRQLRGATGTERNPSSVGP